MMNFFKSTDSVRNISAAEAKRMMDSQERFILLDVRTPEEYRAKHIPTSRLLPLDRLEKEAHPSFPDSSIPIVTYCQSGGRSAEAVRILSRLGYENIYNLGGIAGWPYKTETGQG